MREIVVLSGKGGTGKTSITAALAFVAKENVVVADCDVDAADLHLILESQVVKQEDFYSGFKAEIDTSLCCSCGKCGEVCRFGAVRNDKLSWVIEPLECEGCGFCSYVCPVGAIELKEANVGTFYLSETRTGTILSHAKLAIGADNSGKLVAKVKKEAKIAAEEKNIPFILVDGAPGIGCPVISSLSGANYVLLVTEPTLSGWHDLKRIAELAGRYIFDIGCIINKSGINLTITEKIKKYLTEKNIELLDVFSYEPDFYQAITKGISLIEQNPQKWSEPFTKIWKKISQNKEEK